MSILISNDDGVFADGLRALREALSPIALVRTVAPDRERSAASHALTLHLPLRVKSLSEGVHAVDGTPADCVHMAINGLYKHERPALVIAGINRGGNLGDDVMYSGTVAAAREATILRCQAFAISTEDPTGEFNFRAAALFAARLANHLIANPLPPGVMLNVNVPGSAKLEGAPYRFTRLGRRIYGDEVVESRDPRGNAYYWIAGQELGFESIPESDLDAVASGVISVTPIRVDQTDREFLETLRLKGEFL